MTDQSVVSVWKGPIQATANI